MLYRSEFWLRFSLLRAIKHALSKLPRQLLSVDAAIRKIVASAIETY